MKENAQEANSAKRCGLHSGDGAARPVPHTSRDRSAALISLIKCLFWLPRVSAFCDRPQPVPQARQEAKMVGRLTTQPFYTKVVFTSITTAAVTFAPVRNARSSREVALAVTCGCCSCCTLRKGKLIFLTKKLSPGQSLAPSFKTCFKHYLELGPAAHRHTHKPQPQGEPNGLSYVPRTRRQDEFDGQLGTASRTS